MGSRKEIWQMDWLMVHKSHDGWQAWKQQQQEKSGRRVSAFFFFLAIYSQKDKIKIKIAKIKCFMIFDFQ